MSQVDAKNCDVKICGIASPADYDACATAQASFVGLVFFPRSPRHLTHDQAAALRDHVPKDIPTGALPARVALTVDMGDDEMSAIISAAKPQFLQLHGDETPQRAAALKARFGLKIIKAIRVATADDLAGCPAWEGIADWLLFDAKGDPGGLPGGTGHNFDWSLLANHAGRTKWMLAGGLSVDNVARALAITNASAVDVSSGVEASPGKKDPRLIHAFVSAAQMR
jgi:phosphoribosylanthranilate isomerase